MKRPSISFNGPAIADFLLRHAEKFVVTVAGLAAIWIAWQGVQAVRFQSVRADQTPAALRTGAEAAKKHIAALDKTPEGLLPAHESLATQVAGWRAAQAENRGDLPLLDKPLFEDLARRTQPVALPMEDLRAVAGLAVLPAAQAPAAREPEAPRPSRGRGRGPAEPAAPGPVGPAARIVPYVLVTGLIPAAKQLGEYERAFAAAGYRDARRDAPLWSDFEIDRGSVGPDGKETWQRIDLAATAMQMARWTATAADLVPAPYLLGAAEDGRNAKTTPLAFCGPLPQRIDEPWGPEQVHPWVLEQVRAAAARQVPAQPAPQAVPPAAETAAPSPFGDVPPANQPVPEPVAETSGPAAAAEEPAAPALRMFRFLDTGVESGKVYRYRVRLKVWNPNWRLDPQWLADPALAGPQVLASADSGPSPAVRIPAKLSMLVEPLTADDVKRLRLRPGLFEVLVLDESRATGSYSLRSVLTEMGGVANVEDPAAKAGERGGEQRSRGEPVATGRVLIDVFGAQVDPADMPGQRGTKQEAVRGGPPEPLEMMFVRPDGGVELASAAEAEPLVRRYRETLVPAVKEQPPAGPEAAPFDGQFNPFPQLPR